MLDFCWLPRYEYPCAGPFLRPHAPSASSLRSFTHVSDVQVPMHTASVKNDGAKMSGKAYSAGCCSLFMGQ